jgi:hypothetical protein
LQSIDDLQALHEPPYAERHVRWCERLGPKGPRLLDDALHVFVIPERSNQESTDIVLLYSYSPNFLFILPDFVIHWTRHDNVRSCNHFPADTAPPNVR